MATESSVFSIDFEKLAWETSLPGSRFKVVRREGKQVRLVEFTSTFVEPHWCEKGHVGLVLRGELEVEFSSETVRYPEGTAIFILSGTESRHKARAVTPLVRLFLVEEA